MEAKQTKENRKTRYTRMVLRESLMELMKTKPISSIAIKEICACADISRSTFYTHYRDQFDLLKKTEEETLAFIDKIHTKYSFYKKGTRESLQMLEEILKYIADNNKSIYVLFSENGDVNFQKTIFSSMYQKNVMKSLTDKLPDEQTRQYYYLFVVTGTLGIIYHWIKNGMDKSISELAKIIVNLTSQIAK
ncbi:MAG: TetR/AcrR family transcriptional regulator C-terminal domain-containing protein [Treponema sp.]|nr:TetR/AcrR family transcriptional regulator C-terminal domain-containing protein [Treponema sp.]